jgi:hypothetical protein
MRARANGKRFWLVAPYHLGEIRLAMTEEEPGGDHRTA